jgi:hypothetical protein
MVDGVMGEMALGGMADAFGLRGVSGIFQASVDELRGFSDGTARVMGATWAWVVNDVPKMPLQLYLWLQQPVQYGETETTADWWKIFLLQLLSFACPPLIFWRRIHKVMPGSASDGLSHSRSREFVKHCWWLGSSAIMIVSYYLGRLQFLDSSEIYFNIMLYSFFAVMNSHEAASAKKPPARLRQKPADPSKADQNALPDYAKYVQMSSDIASTKQAMRSFGVASQRLIELDNMEIKDVRFDSFDAQGFESDYNKEMAEGRKGGITEFNRRFNEIIVTLGKYVPWFRRQFEDTSVRNFVHFLLLPCYLLWTKPQFTRAEPPRW